MSALIQIEESALNLLEVDGYFERFYEVLSERGCTQRAAFVQVETEYRAAFRRDKYGNFKSFCRVRRRWYMKRRCILKGTMPPD